MNTSNPMTNHELYLLTECTEWRMCSHVRCKARREIERLRAALDWIARHSNVTVRNVAKKVLMHAPETTAGTSNKTGFCNPSQDGRPVTSYPPSGGLDESDGS
jgi:hypothetical protein